MKFDELRQTIVDSHPSDWYPLNRSGPTYRDRFTYWTDSDGVSGLIHDSHSSVAIFKPDIDITLAYGMGHEVRDGHEPTLSFEWSKKFPDGEIREIVLADVFWRNSLIDRINYVYADGGRVLLPLGFGHQGLKISKFEYLLTRLLDRISGHDEFDYYFRRVPYDLGS